MCAHGKHDEMMTCGYTVYIYMIYIYIYTYTYYTSIFIYIKQHYDVYLEVVTIHIHGPARQLAPSQRRTCPRWIEGQEIGAISTW